MAQNLQAMEDAVLTSGQKAVAEMDHRPKTPTALTFDMTIQPPASTPRQVQMQSWISAVDDATNAGGRSKATSYGSLPTTPLRPVLKQPPVYPPKTAVSATPRDDHVLAGALDRLTSSLTIQLQGMQDQQQQFSKVLRSEVKSAFETAAGSAPAAKPFKGSKTRESKTERVAGAGHIPTQVSTSGPGFEPPPPANTKYYAGVIGRKTGIFTKWRTVLCSVSGYPQAKYKRFRNRESVETWFLEQMSLLGLISPTQDLSDSDSDVTDEETIMYNDKGRPLTGKTEEDPVPLGSRTVPSAADLMDYRMAGPDTSAGESDKIHGVSINISAKVRDFLCPKGITDVVKQRMLEVTPDVLNCTGKNPIQRGGDALENDTMMDHLAEALSNVADVHAQKIGTQARDTQWNLPSRNGIDRVKGLDSAQELSEDLNSQRTMIIDYTKNAYMEILFSAGWTQEDASVYCERGGLILLVMSTYDNLYSLIQHTIVKAYLHPERWLETGQPRIDYYANKLSLIRRFSNRREIMIYRNYTFLRDTRAKKFQDLGLITKLTDNLMELVLGHEDKAGKIPKEKKP